MYTVQALWTAARYRIGAIFVILNNTPTASSSSACIAMRGLAEQADSYVGMELIDPAVDFVGLARSLGVEARARQDRARGDRSGRRRRSRTAAPMLIDVELDRNYKPM